MYLCVPLICISLRLMQLVCQGNSLNLRGFTVQEIAELSEILTVQKNAGALIRSSDSVERELGGLVLNAG
jgi:hypothetical protein